MIYDTFRGSPRPTLGVEIELQLIDSRSMALAGAIDGILAELPPRHRPSVKPEFYESCVEINTEACRDVAEVGEDLGRKLAAVARAAGRHGILLGWGGTHPFSHWRDQPVCASPRYHKLAEVYRETLCRQLTFGLHVHVGVPDGDAAVRVCDRIAEHLPALLALSANSPFWCGRATGLHSYRVEVMGASPTGGLPPRLGGWDAYVRLVDRLVRGGLIETPKDLWWDVRPSPEFGTVEVRVCDMPADLTSVLGLTALIQCLVVALAGAEDPGAGLDECGLVITRQNRWRAARFGLGAELVDPRTGRTAVARDVCKDLAGRLREVAAELGCAPQLELARTMAGSKTGAERQLADLERTGSLHEVVRGRTIRHAAPCPAPGGPGMPAGVGVEAFARLPGSTGLPDGRGTTAMG